MINPYFKDKFPFAYNYFSLLIDAVKENKKIFPQALIFEGATCVNQYLFALELARNLNCKTQKADCDCQNCRWIKNLSHPCVNNVSQIHFKGEGDETKTLISVKQALEIEKALSLSSDYHRFFIFFSSQNKPLEENKKLEFENLGYKSEIDFSIEPLNIKTFHPTTLNALLKSVEEPPEKTTFVFLTNSRENILSTIVSRCLCFRLSAQKEEIKYDDIVAYLRDLNINFDNCFDISEEFLNYSNSNDIDLETLLNKLLEYLKDVLQANIQNDECCAKILTYIEIVNSSINLYRANISPKTVLDNLFLRFARGY